MINCNHQADQYVVSKTTVLSEVQYTCHAGCNASARHGGALMDSNDIARDRGICTLEEVGRVAALTNGVGGRQDENLCLRCICACSVCQAKADCTADDACVGCVRDASRLWFPFP